jgi:membrane associated rhomboid family serine protease
MLIPIGDDDRALTRPAFATYFFVLANIAVFVGLQGCASDNAVSYGYASVPLEIATGIDLVEPTELVYENDRILVPHAPGPRPIYLTLLTSMFLHGSLIHLLGNMLYLWIFGDNIEHRFGLLPFVGLYLAGGIVGGIVQIVADPSSTVPILGASGAVSSVMGAYLVLYPRNRVHALFFIFVVSLPAVVVIGLWIAFQLVEGWASFSTVQGIPGGVAYGAHIGGFAAGAAVAFIERFRRGSERDNVLSRISTADGSRHLW